MGFISFIVYLLNSSVYRVILVLISSFGYSERPQFSEEKYTGPLSIQDGPEHV